MYNQFLNRVAGNTKTVFIRTNNYDLSYLKQPKSNPSLSLLVKSFKYDKWKPILISESLISFKTFVNKINTKIMKWLSSYPRLSKFQKEHFTFYGTSENLMCCSNWNSGVYPLNQGHTTLLPLSVNKWFYTPPSTHYLRPRHATVYVNYST